MLKVRLANLHYATRQEIIEQVANHLLTQNDKCWSGDHSVCAYRNTLGMSCAAGCLIDDSEYSVEFEQNNWIDLVNNFPITHNHMYLIHDLQNIHDEYSVNGWPKLLEELCAQHSLKVPEIVSNRLKEK